MNKDYYKVEQLKKMLVHETSKTEEHYGARLSHWYGDSKTLTIDAGGLKTLISYYSRNDTDLDRGKEKNKKQIDANKGYKIMDSLFAEIQRNGYKATQEMLDAAHRKWCELAEKETTVES